MARELRLSNQTYPCPCCGYMSFEDPPGSYDICQICHWEDDAVQLRFPYRGGANLPLVDAQKNYAAFGACQEHLKQYARQPVEGDVRDPQWRPFDWAIDGGELGPEDGLAYFIAVGATQGTEELYYWRNDADDPDPI